MKRAAALLVLMGTLPALANEDTQRSAAEARFQASEVQLRCAAALTDLNGLTSVNIAGSGSDYRLIIVVQDLRAKLTARQIVLFTIMLVPVSLAPFFFHVSGIVFLIGGLLLGIWFLASSISAAISRSDSDARKLLFASIFYLPLLFLLMLIDRI